MTIPNSFSTEDLENALKQAPKEESNGATQELSEEAYKNKVIELSERFISRAFEELPDPVYHKAIAVMILQNLISYHEKKAAAALEQGEPQVAGLWARDGGQLTASLAILVNCGVSAQDFIAGE